MTTRRGVFAFILGAVAAAKLKPSPAWAGIMPPQPVATVEVEELLRARIADIAVSKMFADEERRLLYGDPDDPYPFEGLLLRVEAEA